jgi:hypothetical protein
MKKKTGVEIYLRALRKGERKLVKMLLVDTKLDLGAAKAIIEKEKARFDREIARGRAAAAELPALRAELERLKNEVDEIAFKVLIAAEKKAPGFAGLPDIESQPELRDYKETVVKLALKDIRRILSDLALEASKAEAEAEKAAFAKSRVKFERGTKLITGELKHWDRASDKLKAYLKATRGSGWEEVWKHYKQHGFTGGELLEEYKAFMAYWRQEKSAKARKSAKKRGRVKRKKSDKRLKEVRRHRKGYCQKCGKKVGYNEKVCDKHLTMKPVLIGISGKAKNPKTGAVFDKGFDVDQLGNHQSPLKHDYLGLDESL